VRIIAIKDMSAGNESVGDMWKETKIFNENSKLIDVMLWVGTNTNVVLTVPDDDKDEFVNKLIHL
jgi:hypothetical protein